MPLYRYAPRIIYVTHICAAIIFDICVLAAS